MTFRGADEAKFEAIWRRYFDLDRDYSAVCERLKADEYMRAAVTEFPGIRILRQEPWEALCSFIISQNNNIPRIKGIIDRLCHLLGEPQLNFYGVSYGTFLGAVYAELYPQNVGRMVLDSAVNLTPSTEVIQAQGFDTSMRNFTSWCAQNPAQCRLGTTERRPPPQRT